MESSGMTLLVLAAMLLASAAPARELANQIEQRVRGAVPSSTGRPEPASVLAFQSLATTATWTEVWPNEQGGEEQRTVTARVWTAAIQACLDRHGSAFLPASESPYYLDGPVVLRSGGRLIAERTAEIRLRPGVSTCLVRNEHVLSGRNAPLPADRQPDTDLEIRGGIWSTLATSRTQSNGNTHGRADRADTVPGCHGLIVLSNVRRVRVHDLVVREGRAYGVHVTGAEDFLVEDVRFEHHGRDGVHVNGPASYGVVRAIEGVTHDDLVALNAWDWLNAAPTFGPIDHVLVERVRGAALTAGAADAIRLLPGVKHFPSGAVLDCAISNCLLRDITDIREFKLYDQPNLELGRDRDFSEPVGTLRDIQLEHLVFTRPGWINVAATTERLRIADVELRFDLGHPANADYRLVEIGPMSMTWKSDPADPASWVEVFSPDRDVLVRGFSLGDVRQTLAGATAPVPEAMARLVRVRDQHLNPDYPKTTPRGGVGKARLLP